MSNKFLISSRVWTPGQGQYFGAAGFGKWLPVRLPSLIEIKTTATTPRIGGCSLEANKNEAKNQ